MGISTIRASRALAAAVAAGLVSACSSSGSSPQAVTAVNPLGGALQVAVGTANIFADMPAAAVTGLNVESTFRQVKGQQATGLSETLVNTPSITGPFVLPASTGTADVYGATILTGDAPAEAGKSAITATPQQPSGATIGASLATTFGVSNGAFSSGIEPFNTTSVAGGNEEATEPVSYAPNPVPAYDTVASDPNSFVPFGGPPAFDPNKTGRGTRDGLGEPSTQLGVEEGLDVFEGVKPVAGSYALSVVVPTSSTSNGTQRAAATLTSVALLPAIPPPATLTADGKGGITLLVTVPAGVTEAYVQIVDMGPTVTGGVSCNGSGAVGVGTPTYYTILARATGTYALADLLGPVGKPSATSPSLCTAAQNTAATAAAGNSGAPTAVDGDEFTVQLVGFDYPAFEASAVNAPSNPTPALTGAAGQADITVSSALVFTQPVGTTGVQTLTSVERSASQAILRGFAAARRAASLRR